MNKTLGTLIRETRKSYSISQESFANACNISRRYLSDIENDLVIPSETVKCNLLSNLNRFDNSTQLEVMIDYVRIRFSTLDVKSIIENVLGIKHKYMALEERGLYSYDNYFFFGDIVVHTSEDINKGVLIELKGKGCRQLELFLEATNRTWYDFFDCCLQHNGVVKRLDIAIDDKTKLLSVAELFNKCCNNECESLSNKFSYLSSSTLTKRQKNQCMGNTLYIGSLRSDTYFCIYEKDYEQLSKYKINIEDTNVKLRFEIRLKNDNAHNIVKELAKGQNIVNSIYRLVDSYIKFYDTKFDELKCNKPDLVWNYFMNKLMNASLVTCPQQLNLDRKINWIKKQVAPSLKILEEIDKTIGTDYYESIFSEVVLNNKQRNIINQAIVKHNAMTVK